MKVVDNMKIDIKDTLTLNDGNEYVVVSKVIFENKTYLYLVSDNGKILFCVLKNDTLKEVKDERLINKLLPLFLRNGRNVINNEI